MMLVSVLSSVLLSMLRQGSLAGPLLVVAAAAFGQVFFCALARRLFSPVLPGRRACSRARPTGWGRARLGYSQLRVCAVAACVLGTHARMVGPQHRG